MRSKARWGKEKIKQFAESKSGINFTRRIPGSADKVLTGISNNPVSQPTQSSAEVLVTPDTTHTAVTVVPEMTVTTVSIDRK